MTAPEGQRSAGIAYVRPPPSTGWRGRLARALYGVAASIQQGTPCPVCQETAQRIGAGGRGAERRAWREGWKLGRRR